MSLAEELAKHPSTPSMSTPPRGAESGVTYKGGEPVEVTLTLKEIPEDELEWRRAIATATGLTIPEYRAVELSQVRYWGDANAPNIYCRFTITDRSSLSQDTDLAELHKQAKKAARGVQAPSKATTEGTSMLVIIADPQVGKTGIRGGTQELLERLEVSRANVVKLAKKHKPSEIILIDAGDAIEGFESSPTADRTNDLQLTEQLRVWRRILWSWTETAAENAPKVKVVSVPSNHCRVRRGKQNMANSTDDFGIEVLAQVADIASANSEKYGHVSFHAPDKWDESIAIELAGGKILGVAHGHQVSSPERLPLWWANQSLGNTPVGAADFLVIGHFHHFRVVEIGSGRFMFVAPTIDSGSDWFRNLKGIESAPAVLTVMVDGKGWRDLDLT